MARQTKRFSVLEMIENVNRKNRESTCSAEVRQGWNAILEDVLHATGNYAGFGYYDESDLRDVLPGVRTRNGGHDFENTDPTRIFFYVKPGLR